MTEIIKVQRPIETNDLWAPWYVYAKGSSRPQMIPDEVVPPEVKSGMGVEFKAFFYGEYSPDIGWTIGEIAPWQEW